MNHKGTSLENDPLARYEEKQEEIKKLLKQIQDGLRKHDRGASTDGGHNWGHVGDLASFEAALREIKDQLHSTGEYAEVS